MRGAILCPRIQHRDKVPDIARDLNWLESWWREETDDVRRCTRLKYLAMHTESRIRVNTLLTTETQAVKIVRRNNEGGSWLKAGSGPISGTSQAICICTCKHLLLVSVLLLSRAMTPLSSAHLYPPVLTFLALLALGYTKASHWAVLCSPAHACAFLRVCFDVLYCTVFCFALLWLLACISRALLYSLVQLLFSLVVVYRSSRTWIGLAFRCFYSLYCAWTYCLLAELLIWFIHFFLVPNASW